MTDMHDRDGAPLAVGDEVTVLIGDPSYHSGSHGVIEKFGTKNAYVRLTVAAFESHDGSVLKLRPESLRRGLHGRPRNSDRMAGIADDFVGDVLADAVAAGIISADQRQRILDSRQKS
jgi:hypothetical protein